MTLGSFVIVTEIDKFFLVIAGNSQLAIAYYD